MWSSKYWHVKQLIDNPFIGLWKTLSTKIIVIRSKLGDKIAGKIAADDLLNYFFEGWSITYMSLS